MKLPRIQPINPTRIAAPFDDPEFLAEIKHDGFRATAYLGVGACHLVSRKQVVYKSFAPLCALMAQLPVHDAILDGELCVIDGEGRSQFMTLMRRRSKDVCYYAFDLLWLNGTDWRQQPLLARKAELRKLVHDRPGFLYADHLQGKAVELFAACCRNDLEGVVIKHIAGPYSEAPCSWVKVLNPDYTQKRGRREMFDKFRERQQAPAPTAPNTR